MYNIKSLYCSRSVWILSIEFSFNTSYMTQQHTLKLNMTCFLHAFAIQGNQIRAHIQYLLTVSYTAF